MAKIANYQELYLREIEELYDAEQRILKSLPKVAEAAYEPQLRQVLLDHIERTNGHVQKLEQVFQGLGTSPKDRTCDGMKGILHEAEKNVGDVQQGAVRDSAIIAAARRVEHYEIAAYSSLCDWAEQYDVNSRPLLEEILQEEIAADQRLAEVAKRMSGRPPEARRAAAP